MARLGAKPPKGVLLYGPPGCSKTMLARAVASESGRNFLSVKGPELYSKWVGDSEKAVRALFKRAKTSSPSVIFIDEIDGLVQTRSEGGSSGGGVSVHDRVLTQLLLEMDGVDTTSQKVAVIAATNMPHLIDPALLRPGRFDRLLYIPLPTDPKDRAAILRAATKKMPLADDVDLDLLGLSLAGYTGADIAGLCREAGMEALEESIDIEQIHKRHFTAAAMKVQPSPPTPDWLADIYQRFRRGQTKTPPPADP
jgi:SpoVK/Ycf46/Vps4 family AAA+-type ATPase